MFWGVTLESGKRYSQIVESSYHLSMAALEPNIKEVGKSNKYVSVMIEHGKSEFLLCTLEYDRVMQVPLDLVFVEGEEVSFFLNGEGVVHLTGYVTDEQQDIDEQSYSEESEEENETSDEEDYSSKLMHVDDSTDDSSNEEWIPKKLNKKNTNIKNNKIPKKLNKELKMESNITTNYKKSKFKNKDDKNIQYENSEELKEIHDDDDDDEHTENYEEIEMNKHFNPKNKKNLKKQKKVALHKKKLTLSPISTPQIPKDMLNEEKSHLSLKKTKKMNNKQKFFKREKPYSEEEREKFQNVLSSKKKNPKKKQYFKSEGGTDI